MVANKLHCLEVCSRMPSKELSLKVPWHMIPSAEPAAVISCTLVLAENGRSTPVFMVLPSVVFPGEFLAFKVCGCLRYFVPDPLSHPCHPFPSLGLWNIVGHGVIIGPIEQDVYVGGRRCEQVSGEIVPPPPKPPDNTPGNSFGVLIGASLKCC